MFRLVIGIFLLSCYQDLCFGVLSWFPTPLKQFKVKVILLRSMSFYHLETKKLHLSATNGLVSQVVVSKENCSWSERQGEHTEVSLISLWSPGYRPASIRQTIEHCHRWGGTWRHKYTQCSVHGQTMVKGFRKSWPPGFYDKLSKPIVTIHNKKHVVLGGKKLYDQERIYARIIGLCNRSVPIDTCLSTELAA